MNFALSDIIDNMDTNDYHTISETGSNAITMRKAKPSVGLRWNAIRAALRWPLRIIGIIMFIMSAYILYNAVLEYATNNIILWQVIGCSALLLIAGFIAFMLAGRKRIKTMLGKATLLPVR